MARDPVAPVAVVVPPPEEVVLDYELSLATAQQFVRFFQGAQHLHRLVTLLTGREQIIQDLDRRRLLAEGHLRQVEEQTQAAQRLYEDAQRTLMTQTEEHTARQAQMGREATHAQELLATLHDECQRLEQRKAQLADEVARIIQDNTQHVTTATDALLASRQEQLQALEAQHLAHLERLQEQSQAEEQRSAKLRADIAELRQRIVASVAEEEA